MRKFALMCCCVSICAVGMAQVNSSLTVSAEDGKKFYLFLSGRLINASPESSMRVQGLKERYYSCKVIFEDKALKDITLKYLPTVDEKNLNVSVSVVYKIQGNSKRKLVEISEQRIAVGVTVPLPAGFVLYEYGISVPAGPPITGWQPAPTRMPGAGVERPIQSYAPFTVPRDTTVQPVTTSVKVDSSKRTDTLCTVPMNNPAYQSAKSAMNITTYDEEKMKAAKAIALNNCLYAKQIADLCMLFDFEETKLSFARFAYTHCYNRKDYEKVVDVLRLDPNKAALRVFIMKDYPIKVNIFQH